MGSRELHEVFNFRLAIDRGLGATDAFFSRFGLVESGVGVELYREGGAVLPIKDPGEVSFQSVTLERGASRNVFFHEWMVDVFKASRGVGRGAVVPPFFKRTISLFQNARKKEGPSPKIYTFFKAFPVAFRAGDWDNARDEIVIESLTIEYDYYTLKVAKDKINSGVTG